MKKVLFDADFERRLIRLYRVLSVYLIERKDVGLAPALYSVFSACWSVKERRLLRPGSVGDAPDIIVDDFPF